MNYRIIKQDERLQVQIDDVSGQEPAILQRVRQCRQSAWACPSAACLDIGSIEERTENGSVLLTLVPRPGAKLDASGIHECLGYMLNPVTKT